MMGHQSSMGNGSSDDGDGVSESSGDASEGVCDLHFSGRYEDDTTDGTREEIMYDISYDDNDEDSIKEDKNGGDDYGPDES